LLSVALATSPTIGARRLPSVTTKTTPFKMMIKHHLKNELTH
jgi:hypothetical protein